MKTSLFALLLCFGCTETNSATNDLSVALDASENGDASAVPLTCTIGGTSYEATVLNPANACQSCQPLLSTTAWSSIADGMSCASGKICSDGSCESMSGCDIDGAHQGTGVINAANGCQICRPSATATDWTNRADGASCGAGLVCSKSVCSNGCLIAATLFMPDAANPSNPCQSCQPSRSTGGFSDVLDGTACNDDQLCVSGACVATSAGCTINGASVAVGTINPGNLCRACQPGRSTTQYTDLPDGVTCLGDHMCISGTCTTGCNIGGTRYTTGYLNPANRCQNCDPMDSATMWSDVLDGRSCGAGKVCKDAVCYDGCTIGGTKHATGEANPANPCQSCQPGVSPTDWSAITNGASCKTAGICKDGTCYDHCEVGGTSYAIGALDPGNPCKSCEPALSPTSFSPRSLGASCGTGQFCDGMAFCISSCYIGGRLYSPDQIVDSCTVCKPSVSASVAQPAPDGTFCYPAVDMGIFGVCYQNACRSDGCYIDGVFHAAGDVHPSNSCLECRPSASTTQWSGREGLSCGTKAFCDSQGFCRFGCSIGGHFYADGTAVVGCTFCAPAVSTSVAQPAPDGTSCSTDAVYSGVCYQHTCQQGCYIDGALRVLGSPDPQNSCQFCAYSSSPYWSSVPEGTLCNGNLTCHFGFCGGEDMGEPVDMS